MYSLRHGRKRARWLMHATIRITRPAQRPVIDPDTLKPVTNSDVIYEGVGKIQSYSAYEQSGERADASIIVTRLRCDIPIGAAEVQPGDHVDVVANPDDPLLAGLSARVAGFAPYKSSATAYRFYIDEER